jgi:hypothetical protein
MDKEHGDMKWYTPMPDPYQVMGQKPLYTREGLKGGE